MSACVLDSVSDQLIISGPVELVIPAKNKKYEYFWNQLGNDDKKLYAGPPPSMEKTKEFHYRVPKAIPDIFGVIFVRPIFFEWYEVDWHDLTKSQRFQFVYEKKLWRKAIVHAA